MIATMVVAHDHQTDDLAAATTPGLVKKCGGLLAAAGAFGVLHVVQLFSIIVKLVGPFAAVPHVMAVLAVAAVVCGIAFARVRTWAPWAAVVVAALLWLVSGAWLVFALSQGLVTLFGFLVPGLAFLGFVFTLYARKRCAATALARERLAREGLEFGA